MPSPEACLPLITALEWGQIHSSVLDQSTLWYRKVTWAADLSLAYTWDDRRLPWQACTDVQSWSSVKHCCSPRKPASWGLFALESVFWRSQLGKLGSDGPRRLECSTSLCISASDFAPRVRTLLLCVQRSMLQNGTYTGALHLASQLFLQLWTCTQFVLELVICEFPLIFPLSSLAPRPLWPPYRLLHSTKPRGTVGWHTTFCQTYSSDCSNLPWERPLNFHSILSFSLLPCDYRHSSWN